MAEEGEPTLLPYRAPLQKPRRRHCVAPPALTFVFCVLTFFCSSATPRHPLFAVFPQSALGQIFHLGIHQVLRELAVQYLHRLL